MAIIGKWTNIVIQALQNIGGQGKVSEIYKEFESIAKANGEDFSEFNTYKGQPNWKATIRRELQQHCSSSKSYEKGYEDLFVHMDYGEWALKDGKINVIFKKKTITNKMIDKKEAATKKSKEIHKKGKEAEIKLTEFFKTLEFEHIAGAEEGVTKRGISYQIGGGRGQIDVIARYKDYLFICHCSTDKIYKNLSDKFEQIPTKQANAITYLKNPKIDAHKVYKIDKDTKVVCIFDIHRVSPQDGARIKKKIDTDDTGLYEDIFMWDTPFKEYYRKEAKLSLKIARSWLLYSVGFIDTKDNKEFECLKIDYGIGGNAPPSFLFITKLDDFYKYAVVSHRIPYLSEADYYQRLLSHKRLKSIASNYINRAGYFPNNIIINVPEDNKFKFIPQEKGSNYGKIKFLERGCAQVIDGQHRLFSYLKASNEFQGNVVINALNVSKSKEAEFFVKINEEQVGIDNELLCDLKGVMYPDDLEGKISNTIKNMNADSNSYFYEKIKMPSFKSAGKQLPISTLFREIKKHFQRFLENKNRTKLQVKNHFYFDRLDPKNKEEGPKRLSSILSDFFNQINNRFSNEFQTKFLNNNTKGVDIKRYTHTLLIETCRYSIQYLGVNASKFKKNTKTNEFFTDLVDSIEQSDWEGLSGYAQYSAYIQELVLYMREVKGHKKFAPTVQLGTDDTFINDKVMTMEQKFNAILLHHFKKKYDEEYFNDEDLIKKYYYLPTVQQAINTSKNTELHPQKHADFSNSINSFLNKSKLDLAAKYRKTILKVYDGRFLNSRQFGTKCGSLWEYGVEVRHRKLKPVQLAKKYNTKQLKIFKEDARDVHFVLDQIISSLDIDLDNVFEVSNAYREKYFPN